MILIKVKYSELNELKFRIYGELVYNYPRCCVDYFIYENTGKSKEYFDELFKTGMEPWVYSGFIPCKTCREKIYGKSRKEAEKILGFKFTNYNKKELKHIKDKQIIVNKVIDELRLIKRKTSI